MQIRNEADVARLVKADPWMMGVLSTAEKLNLPDWWIGAGFLRNKIWDAIEGNDNGERTDIDLVYFDPEDLTSEQENNYDKILTAMFHDASWETCNQARMHVYHNDIPYRSTAEAIARWVETATCIAVRKVGSELEFLWCYGVEDVFDMVARPITHDGRHDPELIRTFYARIAEKGWRQRWPHLVIKDS